MSRQPTPRNALPKGGEGGGGREEGVAEWIGRGGDEGGGGTDSSCITH